MNKQQGLQQLLSSAVAAVGYELWGYEYSPKGGAALLRVYIEKDNGVSIDDCAKASRQIGAVLEVEDLLQGAYNLEVSSPGLNRPLFTLAHYQSSLGQCVKMRLRELHEGRRNFNGTLISAADEEDICLSMDGEMFHFSLDNIEKTNLVYDTN